MTCPGWSLSNQSSKRTDNNHMTRTAHSLLSKNRQVAATVHLQDITCADDRSLETSVPFPPSYLCYSPTQKYGTAKLHASFQVGLILNQTHEEFTSGPLCRQGLVQTCFPSMGAWHQLGNPGLVLVSGTPPMPHWGWIHSRKNYTLCECLSPSVYYKNHCAPTSPWLSENSHEQSVKHYPGKPVITTSGSIWLSVGRALAQRETVTVCKKRSPWLL